MYSPGMLLAAMMRGPLASLRFSSISRSSSSSAFRMRWACLRRERPVSVNLQRPEERSTSLLPNSFSSDCTWKLTAGCVRPRLRAAVEKLPVRATSRKILRLLVFI